MEALTNVIVPILAALLGAAFLYLGNRYVAKKSTEVAAAQVSVDSRKVEQEAFDSFMKQYELDRQNNARIVTQLQDRIVQTDKLLELSLRHIQELRIEMRRQDIVPPAFPDALKRVPFWMSAPPYENGSDPT